MIVADANLISYLCIEGKDTEVSETVLKLDPRWICPLLWRSELLSVFSKYIRASLLTVEHSLSLWRKAEDAVKESRASNHFDVLGLISKSTLSSYDCEFVALARQMSIPLVTFDKKILAAFPDVAIRPDQFVARY